MLFLFLFLFFVHVPDEIISSINQLSGTGLLMCPKKTRKNHPHALFFIKKNTNKKKHTKINPLPGTSLLMRPTTLMPSSSRWRRRRARSGFLTASNLRCEHVSQEAYNKSEKRQQKWKKGLQQKWKRPTVETTDARGQTAGCIVELNHSSKVQVQ